VVTLFRSVGFSSCFESSRHIAPKPIQASAWSTSRALLLAAISAAATYALATALPSRKNEDYSRKDKFSIPQYGTIQDMEAVSFPPVDPVLVS
jgi:hypothetical protein